MPVRWREVWERRIGVFMVAGALLAGGVYYHDVRAQEARSKCQSVYNTAFIETISIRSELATQRQSAVSKALEAQSAVLAGVGTLVALPATLDPKEQEKRNKQFLALFQKYSVDKAEYTSAIEAYDKARAAAPLPTLPPDC